MKFCPDCGASIAEATKFCSGCGHSTVAPTRKKSWPFWLRWLLVTPPLLFAALMLLGVYANRRDQERYAQERAERDPTAATSEQLLALCRPQIEAYTRFTLEVYKKNEVNIKTRVLKMTEQDRANNISSDHGIVEDVQKNGINAQEIRDVWDQVPWLDGLDTIAKVNAALANTQTMVNSQMGPEYRAQPPVLRCILTARLAELKAEPRTRANQKALLPILSRAKDFARSGDIDHAVVEYTRAMVVSPLNPVYYVERGRLYNLKKQYPRAITDLSWALRIDPKVPGAALERAKAFGESGLPVRALVDFKRAIQADPHSAPSYFHRGLLYFHLHHYSRAFSDLGTSIWVWPRYLLGGS